jgi:hypothetical protein
MREQVGNHRFYSFSQTPPEFPPPTLSNGNSSQSSGSSSGPSNSEDKKSKSTTERDSEHLEKMREALGGSDLANVEMEDGVPDVDEEACAGEHVLSYLMVQLGSGLNIVVFGRTERFPGRL